MSNTFFLFGKAMSSGPAHMQLSIDIHLQLSIHIHVQLVIVIHPQLGINIIRSLTLTFHISIYIHISHLHITTSNWLQPTSGAERASILTAEEAVVVVVVYLTFTCLYHVTAQLSENHCRLIICIETEKCRLENRPPSHNAWI